jgi:HSP20 family protein
MAVTFDPLSELDRLTGALLGGRQTLRPMPVDLHRDGDQYMLNADLPGIDPGSVDIDVDGSVLTIRAERTLGAPEGSQWLTRERQPGTFVRQLTLGDGLDAERITAGYDNGVLSVTIPVKESAKPRKIAVTVGGASEQLAVGSGAAGSGPAAE